MKKTIIAAALAAVAAVGAVSASYAHHSFSMFDPGQELVIKGKVARWAFTAPHTFMMIEDENGDVWAFEGAAPPNFLTRNPPMKGDTFVTGQEMTVFMCPLRDGRKGGAAGLFIDAAGVVYNPSDSGCFANRRIAEWPVWVEKGYMSAEEALAAEPAAAE